MSCSLTTDAVRARTKTVTRRHVDTWRTLKAGDRLILVEKAMGLRKGERQVVLAEVEVVDVRVESLMDGMKAGGPAEVAAEGFPGMDWLAFCEFWWRSHNVEPSNEVIDPTDYEVRRIEWRYLP